MTDPRDPANAQHMEPLDDVPAEFQTLIAQHAGLEELLAFALVSNPNVAPPGMLSWAQQVRDRPTLRDDCGGSDE
jgi:hypothetical protein